MLRRVIMAVAAVAGSCLLVGGPAGADYPPVPPKPITPKVTPAPVTPKKLAAAPKPAVVVVVRGAPVPRARLVRTGTSSTLPLSALATASVTLGLTLVCLTRLKESPRRRRRHYRHRFA